MATYSKLISDSTSRRQRLHASIQSHRKSISELEREVKQLDGVISSLEKLEKGPKGPGRTKKAAKGKAPKRGKWKPGSRGRKPQWYIDQQKAKGKAKKPAPKKVAKKAAPKRKKKATPKQLAALAKAREARLANLKKGKGGR